MEEALVGAVRVVHIGSAIALAGGGFLWTLVVAPTLGKTLPGPRIGELMSALGPRMGRYFTILSYVVLASGIGLLASIWGWRQLGAVLFGGDLYGTILLTGILAFFGGLVLAEGILNPTGKRLATQGASLVPAEAARLQQRVGRTFAVIAVLDVIALTMMALAVNARA